MNYEIKKITTKLFAKKNALNFTGHLIVYVEFYFFLKSESTNSFRLNS